MSVETPNIKIDPYQSTVPIVPLTQMPAQDLQPQQAPRIYSRTAGIAQFADTAMKGLLKGLQMKEERKYKTAEAVMQAQDAGIAAARKNYEDLLTTKGAFEADGKTPKAETQAAYQAWAQAVDTAAAQRQAFAIPDAKPASSKSKKKDQNQPDQVPAGSGFGAGLKQFFARNPHIVPELAIIGMKAQVTPYGQMAPEQQAAKMQMDAMARQEANQKVIDAARATYDKYAGRENLSPQEQSDLDNAKAVLTPLRPITKTRVIVNPENGQQQIIADDAQIPEGWKVYERPLASQVPRAGSEQEFTSQALKGYGYTNESAPPSLLKYLHDTWQYRQPQTTSTTSGSTVDINGNRTTTTSATRGGTAPKPPAGFAPVGEDGQPLKEVKTGKMTAPPSAATSKSSASSKGRMTAPPSAEKPTLTQANRTMRVETEEKKMYTDADKAYQAALKNNRAKAPDKASLDAANAQALADYTAQKAQIVLWKAAQIKAIGGDPWKHQAKDAKGNTYGTMDGVNWVNINTGMPYQE